MKKLLTTSLLGVLSLNFISLATIAEENKKVEPLTRFTTFVEGSPSMGFINPLRKEYNMSDGSSMTYNSAEIADKGGAFTLIYTNQNTRKGFDGYPSVKIGGFQYNGIYDDGVDNDDDDSNITSEITGMPIQIKDLKDNLRIKWQTSQENAGGFENAEESDDKWFATINVIFDSADDSTSQPVEEDRDYDLVILRESHNYSATELKDRPLEIDEGEPTGRYWFFAREDDNSIKKFSVYLDGQRYDYAVRYQFFNYAEGKPDKDKFKNDKVHVKFFPIKSNDDSILPNGEMMPFLDHSLKAFIDASKDYFQYVKQNTIEIPQDEVIENGIIQDGVTEKEIDLVEEKLAVDSLWIKTIAAGYEVYRTNSDKNLQLKNDEFRIILDDTLPETPTNLTSEVVNGNISLDWDDSNDDALEAYKLYLVKDGSPLEPITVRESEYTFANFENSANYEYQVSTLDRSLNESAKSDLITINSQE